MPWDAFMSHATEDKAPLASKLADRLTKRGIKVWLDATEIRAGESLAARIDEGIRRSHFSILILTPAYLSKRWTQDELATIISLHEGRILPVLGPKLTPQDVLSFSPLLADLSWVRARPLDKAVTRLVARIKPYTGAAGGAHDVDVRMLRAITHQGWIRNLPLKLDQEERRRKEQLERARQERLKRLLDDHQRRRGQADGPIIRPPHPPVRRK